MLVSFDLYTVLNAIEVVMCIAYLILFVVGTKKGKKGIAIAKLVLEIGIIAVNVCEIPIQVSMGKSYVLSIAMVIVFSMASILDGFCLGREYD